MPAIATSIDEVVQRLGDVIERALRDVASTAGA